MAQKKPKGTGGTKVYLRTKAKPCRAARDQLERTISKGVILVERIIYCLTGFLVWTETAKDTEKLCSDKTLKTLNSGMFKATLSHEQKACRTILVKKLEKSTFDHTEGEISDSVFHNEKVRPVSVQKMKEYGFVKIQFDSAEVARKMTKKGIRFCNRSIPSHRVEGEVHVSITQCMRCYEYSHPTHRCTKPRTTTICSTCAGTDHTYKGCKNGKNPKCIHCGGAHKVTAGVCEVRKRMVKAGKNRQSQTAREGSNKTTESETRVARGTNSTTESETRVVQRAAQQTQRSRGWEQPITGSSSTESVTRVEQRAVPQQTQQSLNRPKTDDLDAIMSLAFNFADRLAGSDPVKYRGLVRQVLEQNGLKELNLPSTSDNLLLERLKKLEAREKQNHKPKAGGPVHQPQVKNPSRAKHGKKKAKPKGQRRRDTSTNPEVITAELHSSDAPNVRATPAVAEVETTDPEVITAEMHSSDAPMPEPGSEMEIGTHTVEVHNSDVPTGNKAKPKGKENGEEDAQTSSPDPNEITAEVHSSDETELVTEAAVPGTEKVNGTMPNTKEATPVAKRTRSGVLQEGRPAGATSEITEEAPPMRWGGGTLLLSDIDLSGHTLEEMDADIKAGKIVPVNLTVSPYGVHADRPDSGAKLDLTNALRVIKIK